MLHPEALLLTTDVARVFDVSAQSVRAWERSGRLPAMRTVGGARVFKAADVLRLQQERADRVLNVRTTQVLVTLLCVLWWAPPASAQITAVQVQVSEGTLFDDATATNTFSSGVTEGNLVTAQVGWNNEFRTMSCTHDGNAMTALSTPNATASQMAQIFARIATTTGTGVTCTASGNDTGGNDTVVTREWSGAADPLSTAGGAGVNSVAAVETNGTAHDSGADLTPDTDHNLFLGVIIAGSNGGTWGDDGFTMDVTGTTGRAGYLIQTAATAGDWVPTTSNTVTAEVVAVNIDGVGGAGPTRRRYVPLPPPGGGL